MLFITQCFFTTQEEVKKKLSKIEAEKGDFDSYLDLEKEKNKGTQRDLRDQLQRAYDDANLLQVKQNNFPFGAGS